MPTGTLSDAFLDLLCADPELVRAEFDELIAASWDTPPPRPRPLSRRPAGRPTPALPIPRGSRRPRPAAVPPRPPSDRERGPPGR